MILLLCGHDPDFLLVKIKNERQRLQILPDSYHLPLQSPRNSSRKNLSNAILWDVRPGVWPSLGSRITLVSAEKHSVLLDV